MWFPRRVGSSYISSKRSALLGTFQGRGYSGVTTRFRGSFGFGNDFHAFYMNFSFRVILCKNFPLSCTFYNYCSVSTGLVYFWVLNLPCVQVLVPGLGAERLCSHKIKWLSRLPEVNPKWHPERSSRAWALLKKAIAPLFRATVSL